MKNIHTWLGVLILAITLIVPSAVMSQALKPGLYAQMETSKGEILLELFYKKVPMTVMNFTGLAEGQFKTVRGEGIRYYDGLTFHRVIPNFMIQGGDPKGTGSGGPGYEFADEFHPELRHDAAGILSMANAGPGTNGSQFFITHGPTPWLDGKHSVFGKVVSGMDVVNTIAKGDLIKTVTIQRVGHEANSFKNDQDSFKAIQSQTQNIAVKKTFDAFENQMKKRYPNAESLRPGLMVVTMKDGAGPTPKNGDTVLAHMTDMFEDGEIFQSTKDSKPQEMVISDNNFVTQTLGTMGKGGVKRLLISYLILGGQHAQLKMNVVVELELVAIK